MFFEEAVNFRHDTRSSHQVCVSPQPRFKQYESGRRFRLFACPLWLFGEQETSGAKPVSASQINGTTGRPQTLRPLLGVIVANRRVEEYGVLRDRSLACAIQL